MTSISRPAEPGEHPVAHGIVRSVVLGLLAILLVQVLAPLPSVADPLTSQLEDAEEELARLDAQVSQVVEDYNEAATRLELLTARLEGTQQVVDGLSAEVAELESLTDGFVRSMYMRGPTSAMGTSVMGLTLDLEDALDASRNLVILDRITRDRLAAVEVLSVRRVELSAAQEQLGREVANAETSERQLAQRKEQVEALVAEQRGHVGDLRARVEAERERVARQRAAEEAARAEAAAEAAAAAAAAEAAAARAAAPTTAPPGTRASAATAVDAALSQVGKPYRYAAEGPDSYDCSGLTMWAWRHAGVALPHSSRMQYTATRRIGRGDLQPGDLVFFGSPIHHVAMYIGDGRVVEAPYSGERVRINERSLSRSDIAGYGRV